MSFVFILCAPVITAYAQSKAPDKTALQNKPAAVSPTQKPAAAKPAMKLPKTAKDLDAFFAEGEKQAKDGPRCEKPPAPVA